MSQGKWAEAKAGNHLDDPAQIYTVSLFTTVFQVQLETKQKTEVSEGDSSHMYSCTCLKYHNVQDPNKEKSQKHF